MLSERQQIEAPSTPAAENNIPPPPSYEEVSGVFASETYEGSTDGADYFLGEVTVLFINICGIMIGITFQILARVSNCLFFILKVVHSFKAVTDVELSLSIGDFVVVRKVLPFFFFYTPIVHFTKYVGNFECGHRTKLLLCPISFSISYLFYLITFISYKHVLNMNFYFIAS